MPGFVAPESQHSDKSQLLVIGSQSEGHPSWWEGGSRMRTGIDRAVMFLHISSHSLYI